MSKFKIYGHTIKAYSVEQLSSGIWRIAMPMSRSNGELIDLFFLPVGDYDKAKSEMLGFVDISPRISDLSHTSSYLYDMFGGSERANLIFAQVASKICDKHNCSVSGLELYHSSHKLCTHNLRQLARCAVEIEASVVYNMRWSGPRGSGKALLALMAAASENGLVTRNALSDWD